MHSRISVLVLYALALAVGGCAVDAPQRAPAPTVVAGSPELANMWWQWATSAPRPNNPLTDRTGENCGVGQQGDVWFLAGGFGNAYIRRVCTVPQGKALFFPLINMVQGRGRRSSLSCEQAKAYVKRNNETATDLFAEIDGVPVPDLQMYRLASDECFDMFSRVPAGQGGYNAYPTATDGYWLKITPLPKGRHTLKFGGRYDNPGAEFGTIVQDIEYVIFIE